jgi:hypothetical protein
MVRAQHLLAQPQNARLGGYLVTGPEVRATDGTTWLWLRLERPGRTLRVGVARRRDGVPAWLSSPLLALIYDPSVPANEAERRVAQALLGALDRLAAAENRPAGG